MTLPANIITTLPGSVMFRHSVDVYLRHQPGPMGTCTCGNPGCRCRYNASVVIGAAGVDLATLTAADAAPRPWHERPVPAATPGWGTGAAQEPAHPTGTASAPDAARPAPAGGWGHAHPPALEQDGGRR